MCSDFVLPQAQSKWTRRTDMLSSVGWVLPCSSPHGQETDLSSFETVHMVAFRFVNFRSCTALQSTARLQLAH